MLSLINQLSREREEKDLLAENDAAGEIETALRRRAGVALHGGLRNHDRGSITNFGLPPRHCPLAQLAAQMVVVRTTGHLF